MPSWMMQVLCQGLYWFSAYTRKYQPLSLFYFIIDSGPPGSGPLKDPSSKVMLKILQARLQQYVNCELPDVQAGFRKGRGTRDQIANIHWITEKARESRKKHLFLLHWLCQSLWLCGSQQTGKFWKRWAYQTSWLASWEACMQVRKQQLELDMEKQTGSE